MKPVILLTGKNGQVGGELLRILPQLGEVAAFGRDQMDLSKPADIRRTIREVRPQLIVNAAAYTGVDQAETDETMAHAINAEAPELIAVEAKKIGATLLHCSTDYVFDGNKRAPYDEADSVNPLNVYGKTKLAGEQAIGGSGVPHLIFRTAWVYATRGRNFLLTVLRLATEREELRIVSDQVGAPTCAADFATATCKILAGINERNREQFDFSEVSGTYHVSAAGQTTWYDFAMAILEEAKASSDDPKWLSDATKGRQVMARRVIPISTEEFQSPTHRPSYSVLSNSKLAQTFGVALPEWRSQLRRCFVSANPAVNSASSCGAA
ncbi:MAG TPA: dTDP-4-dehydrorhamnose reductase [Candidatus Acidoferrum sp.]|nr:dTDP-4-dehydrorhamnose reductase [Candidatus Acidoferrum sp.]